MNTYKKFEVMLKNHQCSVCHGAGAIDDAEPGDIEFNRRVCCECAGTGFAPLTDHKGKYKLHSALQQVVGQRLHQFRFDSAFGWEQRYLNDPLFHRQVDCMVSEVLHTVDAAAK